MKETERRIAKMVGPVGLEPTTPDLSGPCSNQLSYEPIYHIPQLRPQRGVSPIQSSVLSGLTPPYNTLIREASNVKAALR